MNNTRNLTALREAQQTVIDFETLCGMTSQEMLACAEGDPRLKKLNSFEMMDWHYALEQVKAFASAVDCIHSVAEAPVAFCFRYERKGTHDLENVPESEFKLVA